MSDDDAAMLAELRALRDALDGPEPAQRVRGYGEGKWRLALRDHGARLLELAEAGLRTRDDVALWQGRYEGAQEENARLRAKVAMGGSALGLAADEAKRMRERVAELEARARCAGCDTLAKPEDECWSCRL